MNNEEKNVTEVQEQKESDPTAISESAQENIFNDIFGQQAEPIVATQENQQPDVTNEGEISDVQSNSDPKNDESQFQYWQSQADKRGAEVDLLKAQVTELMKSKQVPSEEPVKKEIVKLEKPIKPSKPADYDHSEALADPESSSAKYLTQREQYLDNMTEYMTETDNLRNKQIEETTALQRKELSRQKLVNDLQAKYDYSNEDASDFIETMSSPESLTLDNLVQLHKMRKGSGPQQVTQVTPEAQQKQALMSNRQEKLSIPKPIGVQPGASTRQSSKVEDQMMDSMVANYKKKNPF